MPYISINNSKWYYEEQGNGGETLIFGHSMLFNLRMFDEQVNRLSNRYRCIRFDFKGHGNSEAPEDGYDLDTLTSEVGQLIRDLNLQPVHFVGFSMGGMVALRLAITHPELLKSLILIDTSSEPEPKTKMLQNQAMLWVAKHLGLKPLAGKVMNMFFGQTFLKDPERRSIRKTWKNHFLANDRKGIVRAVKGVLYRSNITPRIQQIHHPTTVMVGAEDQLTDLEKAEIIHSQIKNSELHIIPRAGHMSPVEEPDMVNELMANHLNSLVQ